MEVHRNTAVPPRPNAARYLAALAACCQYGINGGEEEALAVIEAIVTDVPRWWFDYEFATTFEGFELPLGRISAGLQYRLDQLPLEAGRPARAMTAGG